MNEVISDNQIKQEMDHVSMGHKIPKKLVTWKEHIMDQYPDVFEGIDQFPGEPHPDRSKSTTEANIL